MATWQMPSPEVQRLIRAVFEHLDADDTYYHDTGIQIESNGGDGRVIISWENTATMGQEEFAEIFNGLELGSK